MTQYINEYGTVYAVREKDGVPRLMCRAKDAAEWQISGTLASLGDGTQDAGKLQAALDKAAAEKGWTPAAEEGSDECPYLQPLENSRKYTCQCAVCGEKFVTRETCNKSFRGCGWYQDKREKDAPCPPSAPPPDPAAPPEAQSLPAAAAASLAEGATPPAFDYTGMSARTVDTLHLAERMIREARRDYVVKLAKAVGIVHEELVQNLHKQNNQYSDDTFCAWCASVGIGRRTAYNLLQVDALMSGSTPEEQAALEQAGPSLLYAAAKPSAPAELVQAVKNGDITTHKQYRELLKQYQDTLAENQQLRYDNAIIQRTAQRADEARKDAEAERDQARREKKELAADCNRLGRQAEKALRDKHEAEKSLAGARDALQAAKLRGDKLRAENETLRAQAQAAPATVEATVLDPDEVARLADEKARALLARWQAEQPAADTGEALRSAYDAAVLFARQMDTAWQMFRPHLAALTGEADRRQALGRITQKWDEIYEEMMECP